MNAAHKLVPEGSTCLPLSLKEAGAPRLEVAAINSELVVCAIDIEPDRLLGRSRAGRSTSRRRRSASCPSLPLRSRAVASRQARRSLRAGYCLPKDAKVPGDRIVHMTWHPDGAKVAVVVGDDLHLYDAASKAHEKSFSIRGEKGVLGTPNAVHWVGDVLYVEGSDDASAAVWAFKPDGTAIGAIEAIGTTKPASTRGGSFSVLDRTGSRSRSRASRR